MQTFNKGQTGPKSIQGKQNSSMNAKKHGAYSKGVVLPSENFKDYEKKVRHYQKSLKIKGELGKDLAHTAANHYWVARRMQVQLVRAQEKYYALVDPIQFAMHLRLPHNIAQKAPTFLTDPTHETSREIRDHALSICQQIELLRGQLPWGQSFQCFCDQYPELKLALDAFLTQKESCPLQAEDGSDKADGVWNSEALHSWNLNEIYSTYFYVAFSENFKEQLYEYMEDAYSNKLNELLAKDTRAMELLAQRSQKELNAMRSTLQLAMSFSKLIVAHDESAILGPKKRNRTLNSAPKSVT